MENLDEILEDLEGQDWDFLKVIDADGNVVFIKNEN